MKLAEFKIKTMADNEIIIEAFSPSQAITIWKASKPTELFKSCSMIKSSKPVERYRELFSISEPTKEQKKELQNIVAEFHETDIFKQFKRYTSFKREPRIGD